jgi:hypothetical protein
MGRELRLEQGRSVDERRAQPVATDCRDDAGTFDSHGLEAGYGADNEEQRAAQCHKGIPRVFGPICEPLPERASVRCVSRVVFVSWRHRMSSSPASSRDTSAGPAPMPGAQQQATGSSCRACPLATRVYHQARQKARN